MSGMKIKIGVLSAALVALVAGSAQAQTNGWYAGLMGGWNYLQDSDVSPSGFSGNVDFDHGFGVLGNVGYGWGKYRLEGELGYRRNGADSVSGSNTGVGTGGASGSAWSTSLMLNGLYDIPIDFPVKPHVGAGIGLARVDFDGIKTSGGTFANGSDWTFAYQGIAGLGWDIDPAWRLNLDYRYFATLDVDVTSNGRSADAEYRNHSVMLGFAYRFGQPAPKPQPVAAPAPAPMAQPAPPPPPPPAAPAPARPAPRNFLVFFDWDKADITAEAQKIIEQAVAYTKQGNFARVELVGHADRSGTNKYNMALSLRRANAVKAAMVKLGLGANAIGLTGKGEEQPLVPTADGVREPQNRRVEILLP